MGQLIDDPRVRLWLYVDDIVIQAAPAAWPDAWQGITMALQAARFELCAAKSAWYCPVQRLTDQYRFRHIFQTAGIREEQDAISILGTEASHLETETFLAHTIDQGTDSNTTVPTQRAITGPMHRRLQRALLLNRRVAQLATTTTQAGAAQPAWAITRLITAHSLDYDFRVLPLTLTAPAATILRDALVTCMTAATGTQMLTQEQEAQAFLPTQYAGLQLQCPETTAPLARAAHLIENGHHIRDSIKRWADKGLTTAAEHTHDGVEGPDFDRLARALDGLQHSFGPTGLPITCVGTWMESTNPSQEAATGKRRWCAGRSTTPRTAHKEVRDGERTAGKDRQPVRYTTPLQGGSAKGRYDCWTEMRQPLHRNQRTTRADRQPAKTTLTDPPQPNHGKDAA